MAFTKIGFDVFESERLLSEQEGSVTDEMRGEDGRVGTFPTLAEAQAEAERLATEAAHTVEVTPTRYGIGSATYMNDFLDYREDSYETVGMVLKRSRESAGMKAGHSH